MDEFSRYAIRVSVAQICQTIGWSKIQTTPLEVLTDYMQEYILGIGKLANNYAMIMGQTEPNLSHVALAFGEMGVSLDGLKEYIEFVESDCVLDVPKYPIRKESHLNHLKPGSREVLTRPVHVHEHLPPMYPHLENGERPASKSPIYNQSPDIEESLINVKTELMSDNSDEFIDDTVFEDDMRQLRELSSVLMTTSGYLSAAREGKLPEVRTTIDDFIASTPQGEEESKRKKFLESVKKLDKENRKKKKSLDRKDSERRKLKKKKKHRGDKVLPKVKTHEVIENVDASIAVSFNTPLHSIHEQEGNSFATGNCDVPHTVPKVSEESIKPVAPLLTSDDASNFHFDHKDGSSDDASKFEEHYSNDSLDDVCRDIKESNSSFVDLFSVPQGHKDSFSEKEDIIGVLNSSPHSDIAQHLNHGLEFDKTYPPFELAEKNVAVHLDSNGPSLDFNRHGITETKFYQSDIFNRMSAAVPHGEPFRFESEKFSPLLHCERKSPMLAGNAYLPPSLCKECPEDSIIQCKPEVELVDESIHRNKKKKKKDKKNKNKDQDKSEIGDYINRNGDVIKKKKKKHKLRDKGDDASYAGISNKIVSLEKNEHEKEWNDFPGNTIASEPTPHLFHNTNPSSHSSPKYHKKRTELHYLENSIQADHSLVPSNDNVSFNNPSPLQFHDLQKPQKKLKVLYPLCETRGNEFKSHETEQKITQNETQSTSFPEAYHKKTKHDERKKEKKEKRKDRGTFKHLSEDLFTFEPLKRVKSEEKAQSLSPVPKITFKLGPSPPIIIPEASPKIVIKPIIKKEEPSSLSTSFNLPDNNPTTKSHKEVTFHSSVNPPVSGNSSGPCLFPEKKDESWSGEGNQIWICPACNLPDDGSPMIACDKCDLWFHWVCVGIREVIEGDWYCKACIAKREHEKHKEKKKKHKKKKI